VAAIRDHLRADLAYQSRLVRFLENHDEPRIATLLPVDAERAAAVTIATLPGATLWHEGQFEGRRVRPPVFLSRRPDEALDPGLADWYRRLLTVVAGGTVRTGPVRTRTVRKGTVRTEPVRTGPVRTGKWRLLEASGWPNNQSCRHLVAWSWDGDDHRHVVVVNLSEQPAQGQIPLPWVDVPGRSWRLTDHLRDSVFDRDGDELANPGLFVDLAPWQCHLLAMT
jgi:hypothetical protein